MSNPFFDHPILNSPYECPRNHWELDPDVQPQPPRETVQVKAMRPERDALKIQFPRVDGYRVELPEERLEAKFTDESVLRLTTIWALAANVTLTTSCFPLRPLPRRPKR